jgi:hypothetical protein
MKFILYGNLSVDYCSEVHHAKSIQALGHEVIGLQETVVPTEQVLAQSLQADALIWIHSHGFNNPGNISMIEVLRKLKQAKVKTLAYHLDLYMPLPRWEDYKNSEYLNELDYFFTVDALMADWLNTNTSCKGVFLPAGVLADECYMLDIPRIKDVVFTGSYYYHPEWSYRPQLIDWLRNTYGDRFTHHGSGGLPNLRGHELNKLYSSSKIVVGDTL